jgi:hypothetical protein
MTDPTTPDPGPPQVGDHIHYQNHHWEIWDTQPNPDGTHTLHIYTETPNHPPGRGALQPLTWPHPHAHPTEPHPNTPTAREAMRQALLNGHTTIAHATTAYPHWTLLAQLAGLDPHDTTHHNPNEDLQLDNGLDEDLDLADDAGL